MGFEGLTSGQLIEALRKGKLELESMEWFLGSKTGPEASEFKSQISKRKGLMRKFERSKGSVDLDPEEVSILESWLNG